MKPFRPLGPASLIWGCSLAALVVATGRGPAAAFAADAVPRAIIERSGHGCLRPATPSLTPGAPTPAPPGSGYPPGRIIVPTEPNLASAEATGGRASFSLRLRVQPGINEYTHQPLKGGLIGATICRQLADRRWQRVAEPKWNVRAGAQTTVATPAWLRAHGPLLAPLGPGRYRLHIGLTYWWGQRNLFIWIR